MTRTEWFSRAWKLDKEINRLIEKRSRIYAAALRITPTYSDMPKCQCSTDAIQDTIDRICEIDEKINQRIDRLHTVKSEIIDAIRTVENTTDRLCMVKRFVEMKSLGEIAREVGKSRNAIPFYIKRGIKSTTYCIGA
jgi:predicted DNA-binding protein YlxM (UPF0122 family)